MNTINQNSLLNSIYEALTPGAALIDGRTEQDWLRFLSDFGTLINFFDQDNQVNGNWEPFLLKDPVFLTASIAGTRFTRIYTLYLRSCHKLEQLLLLGSNTKDLPVSFNQLFDQLIAVFVRIRKWACYMRRSTASYPLKTYVNKQIKTTFASLFQAILSLRQEMFSAAMIVGLTPVDPILIEEFGSYEERIWKEGEFIGHYWELLGLLHPIKENKITAIFKVLTNAGDTLFNFLKVIIAQADTEFGRLAKLKSSYPDTTLLRTFIHLLRVQQDQLNEISAKHLAFYYKGILKQTERRSQADRAYIIASLTTKDALFVLPAGTLFDAGTDAEKNPVVFESTEDVVLNPAAIPMAYTLSRAPASNELSKLQLQTILNPGVLQKDAEGKILSWDTFGSPVPDPTIQKSTGIAFASPMLLLREGTRILKLSLEYNEEPNLNLLRCAKCYLSTLNGWLEVTTDFQLEESSGSHTIAITITLQSTDPAIERFLVNPDGIVSSWPMFKLIFEQITDADVPPPVLHALKIEVNVSGLETFQLYNDYGALSSKVAFPPFGPAPVNGSNFIIGSNEIFSKPLNSLTLQLDWSALPPDFSVYYQAYNLYLNNQLKLSNAPDLSWWEMIFGKKESTQPVMPQEDDPYNNTCFVVGFQVLEEKTWTPVGFNTLAPEPVQPADPAAPNLLFTAVPAPVDTSNVYSSTAMPLTACDPALQNQPAKFTELSTAGFMKMELKGPAYGFGSAIYPNVVSAVTMYNSQILYNKEELAFADPVQLPFTPKLTSFSAAYAATVQYVFDAETQQTETLKDYPVQVFSYTPFTNYTIYDNLNQPPVQKYTIGDSSTAENDASGIPLYTAFNYGGFLYLSIDNLIPASSFNLYFELARKYINGNPAENKIDYYYLGTEGWAPLIVLSDGTDNLSHSGIVSLNIPEDITLSSNLMPGGSYWIVIAADDISAVAATVLLSTNGLGVQRSGTGSADTVTAPVIPADAITKTKKNVPKISVVQQPFPSFDGKVAEDTKAMNQRISHRLKTKDRAVTATDYLLLIRQEFKNIYDAVVVYDATTKTTNVYVVKSVDSWKMPHAFQPMVSVSEEKEIQLFLQQRTSAFSIIKVLNPDFQSVSVCATITVQPGYELLTVQQRLIQALNVYLSPWIKDSGVQVDIYKEITNVQVAAFIRTITGVATVESIYFNTGVHISGDAGVENTVIAMQTVRSLKKSALFISNQVHELTLNYATV